MEMVNGTFPMAFWLIFAGIFVKILATAMTLGWGGSGGIFAPLSSYWKLKRGYLL